MMNRTATATMPPLPAGSVSLGDRSSFMKFSSLSACGLPGTGAGTMCHTARLRRMRIFWAVTAVLLSACHKAPIEERGTPVAATVAVGSPVKPMANDAGPATVPEPGSPGTPGGLPDDRTPLAEPKGPIDPKSAEGAGQVVQLYAALIEEGKLAEADKAWRKGIEQGPLAPARLATFREVHGEVGKPFDHEGAMGSCFIMVPLRIYGVDKAGKRFNFIGPLTLRRVNDVDGSTDEQRRWHIVKNGLVAKG